MSLSIEQIIQRQATNHLSYDPETMHPLTTTLKPIHQTMAKVCFTATHLFNTAASVAGVAIEAAYVSSTFWTVALIFGIVGVGTSIWDILGPGKIYKEEYKDRCLQFDKFLCLKPGYKTRDFLEHVLQNTLGEFMGLYIIKLLPFLAYCRAVITPFTFGVKAPQLAYRTICKLSAPKPRQG